MEREFFHNSVREWLTAGGTFVALWLAFVLLKRQVFDRLRKLAAKTQTRCDDEIVNLLDQFRGPEGAVVSFWFASRELELPPAVNKWIHILLLLVLTYRAVRIVQDVAAVAVRRLVIGDDHADLGRQDTVRNIGLLNNVVIWSVALLFLLGNFGVNVPAIITGLGVTGVAVALGAQAILSDLFSAVVIYMDEPFTVGDSIMVENFQGVVEHIGIKTTRMRSLSGEMLIFPNSYLTAAKVRNFKHLKARRVLFDFGVSRATPPEKLKKVVDLIKGIVDKTPHVRLERAHFKGIDEDSLDFEVVYHVLEADYGVYMDAHQHIQLELIAALAQEKVELAYPTHVAIQMPVEPTA